MNNSIFDLLNFDFTDVVEKIDDLRSLLGDKYNNFVNENIKKYDITTDEGYKAFIDEAANIRKQLEKYNDSFSQKLLLLLDTMVNHATDIYTEAKVKEVDEKHYDFSDDEKKESINSLINKEVERNKEENHGRLNIVNKEEREDKEEKVIKVRDLGSTIDRPSSHITPKQMKQLWQLVDEYMDEMIIPYIPDEDYRQNVVDDMSCGLFEFASWVMNHDELED